MGSGPETEEGSVDREGAERQGLEGLADRLHRVAIRILRRLRREDEALGLSPARLSALSVLVFGGAKSLTELALEEQVRPPSMSRLVRALEADGLVERRANPDDGRAVLLTATHEGRRLLHEGRRRRVGRLARDLADLPAEERAVVERAVTILEI